LAANQRQFTGPIADVLAKVEPAQKKGQLGSVRRVDLSAVENRPASVHVGEKKLFVIGLTVAAVGQVRRVINHRRSSCLLVPLSSSPSLS